MENKWKRRSSISGTVRHSFFREFLAIALSIFAFIPAACGGGRNELMPICAAIFFFAAIVPILIDMQIDHKQGKPVNVYSIMIATFLLALSVFSAFFLYDIVQ